MTPDIANFQLFLEHGKPYPIILNKKGIVNSDSLVGYEKYTKREESRNVKENLATDSYGYLDYTKRTTSRDLEPKENLEIRTFTNKGWISSLDEIKKLKKEIRNSFSKDGNLAWIPVTSFKDYVTAKQYGLFTEDDYAAVFSKVLPKFFNKVGLDNSNMIYWMDYHTNTDHPHTHLVFLEKNQTRTIGKFTQSELDYFKSLIFKEVYFRERLLNNTNENTIVDFKYKDTLFKDVQLRSKQIIKEQDDSIQTKIEALYINIDNAEANKEKGKRLQYNSVHMKDFREELDSIVDDILNDERVAEEYNKFIEKCDKFDQVKSDRLTTIYHSIRDSEDNKLRTYLANQILKNKKDKYLNYNLPINELKQLSTDGDVYATRQLAKIYSKYNNERSTNLAINYSIKGIALGDKNSSVILSDIYFKNGDNDAGEKILVDACNHDNDYAMFNYSRRLNYGDCVKQNKTKAEYYYNKSASMGNDDAIKSRNKNSNFQLDNYDNCNIKNHSAADTISSAINLLKSSRAKIEYEIEKNKDEFLKGDNENEYSY